MRRVISGIGTAFFLACSNEPEGRLEFDRDTLFLYGGANSDVSTSLRLANDSLAPQVKLTAQQKAFVRTSGSRVKCLREGSSVVEARAGSLVKSLVVICRIATKIAGETYFVLEPDAKPVDLSATATFPSGESVTLRPITASSTDTSVAVIRAGMLTPRRVGHTGLMIDYGGVRSRGMVNVQRTVFDSLLTLKEGESRRWQLDGERYTISVKVTSRQDLNRLNMETEGLNCSRDSRDEDTIHCVTTQRAQVTILNRGKGIGASSGAAQAQVRIRQIL